MKLFRRKEAKHREAYTHIYNMALHVIGAQFTISGGRAIEDVNGNLNKKALGYIYGFVDAALQSRALTIDNEYGSSVLVGIYNQLWPGEGGNYYKYVIDHIPEAELIGGIAYGGQEFCDWQNDNHPPGGLLMSLIGK